MTDKEKLCQDAGFMSFCRAFMLDRGYGFTLDKRIKKQLRQQFIRYSLDRTKDDWEATSESFSTYILNTMLSGNDERPTPDMYPRFIDRCDREVRRVLWDKPEFYDRVSSVYKGCLIDAENKRRIEEEKEEEMKREIESQAARKKKEKEDKEKEKEIEREREERKQLDSWEDE